MDGFTFDYDLMGKKKRMEFKLEIENFQFGNENVLSHIIIDYILTGKTVRMFWSILEFFRKGESEEKSWKTMF